MQYFLLFLEGIITFVSPCLLPMLPIYVSYFAANPREGKRGVLSNALGFVLGFTLVFVAMGAFAGTLGRLLRDYSTVFNLVTGMIVLLFGLNFMGVLKIGFLNRTCQGRGDIRVLGFFSSVAFGFVFSIGWTPCVGAFLGSALMLAGQQGSALQGIWMLLAFSAGLGIPFVLSAVLLEQMKSTFDFIKKHSRIITVVSGGLLAALGVLMMTGTMGYFLSLLTF